MQRTVTRLFDSRSQAEAAVRELEAQGFPSADLTFLSSGGGTVAGEDRSFLNKDGDGHSDTLEGAGEGAVTGGAIGAGVGLLAGLTAIAVPGLGTAAAAGSLASTL
ncbi:MAG: hypothetical protein K1X35_10405, partial [Caulobacteraceae bacterium]|nr:hypothetical protein [Caulobacteraceae bacterium]